MTRRVIEIGIGLLALVLIAVLPVAAPPGSDGAFDAMNHQPAGGIADGVSAVQQFPASGDAIRTVTVYLATFGRVNRGVLHLSVLAETAGGWQHLATRDLDERMLQDNSYTTLAFSPPLPVARGKGVRLVMEASAPATDAVTWWTNPQWTQPGYQLTYNMNPVAGSAVFQVHYTRETRPLVLALGGAWPRVTTFLTAPWQGLLVIALVGMAASVALIFRRLPNDESPPATGEVPG